VTPAYPPMATLAPAPFAVLDHRCPSQPMIPLPGRLPATALAQLQAAADRLGYSRGALARTFLVQGLEQLEAGGPLVVLDHRCPDQPMAPFSVKVPAAVPAQLQAQAARLGCCRTALGRALQLQGLAQLEAVTTPGPC
jgi:hypothetical protein